MEGDCEVDLDGMSSAIVRDSVALQVPLATLVTRLRRGSPPSVALITFERSHATDHQPTFGHGAFHLLSAEGVLRFAKLAL